LGSNLTLTILSLPPILAPVDNKVYYGLERQAKSAAGLARDYKDRRSEMDNPDQRIQEDIDSFTAYSLSFFLTIVNTSIDLVR
jgi:ABC-type uncharacterized transport system fused permease/ATPase subunit